MEDKIGKQRNQRKSISNVGKVNVHVTPALKISRTLRGRPCFFGMTATGIIDVPWDLLHRITRQRRGVTVWLCRNRQDESLAVAKIWGSVSYGTAEPREITTLRNLPYHPRLVHNQQILEDWPSPEDFTVIMSFCDGGTVEQLGQIAESRGEWIPQELIWHIIGQILDGLEMYASLGVSHRDLHGGNVFLDLAQGLPEIKIGDPRPLDRDFRLDEDMQFDLWSFSDSIWSLMTTQTYYNAPYSGALVRWVRFLRFAQDSEQAKWSTSIEQLHPQAKNLSKQVELPGWIVNYFEERRRNVRDSTWFERYRQSFEAGHQVQQLGPGNEQTWNGEFPRENLALEEYIQWAEDMFLDLPDRIYSLVFRDGAPTGPLTDAEKIVWIISRMRKRARSIFQQFMKTEADQEFDLLVGLFDIIDEFWSTFNALIMEGVVEDLSSPDFSRNGLIDELRDLRLIKAEVDGWILRS